jgi:hypothetical protein
MHHHTGKSKAAFNINTSGFQSSFGGSFGIAPVGNDLSLTHTAAAVREPTSFLLVAAAAGGMAWQKRRRKRALAVARSTGSH